MSLRHHHHHHLLPHPFPSVTVQATTDTPSQYLHLPLRRLPAIHLFHSCSSGKSWAVLMCKNQQRYFHWIVKNWTPRVVHVSRTCKLSSFLNTLIIMHGRLVGSFNYPNSATRIKTSMVR